MAKRAHDDGGGGGSVASAAPSVPSLGDIMGGAGLPPSPSLGAFTPAQRIALSANGNLQRLVSSYYNSPVFVAQVYNRPAASGARGAYDRQVTLAVAGVEFCTATSSLELSEEPLIEAVEVRGVGIGQLFRHHSILPTCEVHAAALEPGGGFFWREYTLSGAGVACKIHERFRADLFDLPSLLEPPTAAAAATAAEVPAAAAAAAKPTAAAALSIAVPGAAGGGAAKRPPISPPAGSAVRVGGGLGDIMSANATGMDLPDGFTPLQRMLLTANGNVERIVSSYYASPASPPTQHHQPHARSARPDLD